MLFPFLWWAGVDSNHRSLATADLQSAPFSHSGTYPYLLYSIVIFLSYFLSRCSDWRTTTGLVLVKRYLIFLLRVRCLRAYSGTYPYYLYLIFNLLFNLPLTRFELVASPLPRECATPAPQGLIYSFRQV